jgi:hypothetical protein
MGLIKLREEAGRLYLPNGSLADIVADFPTPAIVQCTSTSAVFERNVEESAKHYSLANAYLPGTEVSMGPSELTPVHFYAVKISTQRATKK